MRFEYMAAWLLGFAVAAPSGAHPLAVLSYPCGTANRSLCVDLDPSNRVLTTTIDSPDPRWTIDPIAAPNQYWKLTRISVGFTNDASFFFAYADGTARGSAQLNSARFMDASGSTLVETRHGFDPFCVTATVGPYTGHRTCSDGDSLYRVRDFGARGEFGGDFDPNLPHLDGPITIAADWSIFNDAMTIYSEMVIRGAYCQYQFDPVPEPGTLALAAAGLLALGLLQRSRQVAAHARLSLPLLRGD